MVERLIHELLRSIRRQLASCDRPFTIILPGNTVSAAFIPIPRSPVSPAPPINLIFQYAHSYSQEHTQRLPMSRPGHPHPRPPISPARSGPPSPARRTPIIRFPTFIPFARPSSLELAHAGRSCPAATARTGVPEDVETLEERIQGDFKYWCVGRRVVFECLEEVHGDESYSWREVSGMWSPRAGHARR